MDPVDVNMTGVWPIAGHVYISFLRSIQLPDDLLCTYVSESFQFLTTLATSSISDILASSLRVSAAPRSIRSGAVDDLNTITCNDKLTLSYPGVPKIDVPLFMRGEDEPLADEAYATYELAMVPSRAPFFDSIGHTISEGEAESFELSEANEVDLEALGDAARGLKFSAGSRAAAPPLLFVALLCSAVMLLQITGATPRPASPAARSRRSPRLAVAFLVCILACSLCAQRAAAVRMDTLVPERLRLAALMDFTSRDAGQAAEEFTALQLSVLNINADPNILPDTEVELFPIDTAGTLQGTSAAVIAASNQAVDAIVGLRDSANAMVAVNIATLFRLPVVSHGAATPALSGSDTFVRVIPSSSKQALGIAAMIARFEFSQYGVAILAQADIAGIASANEFLVIARQLGIPVTTIGTVAEGTELDAVLPVVEAARASEARTMVCFLNGEVLRDVMRVANELDMVNENYFWAADARALSYGLLVDNKNIEDPAMPPILRGLVVIAPLSGSGPAYEQFVQDWLQLDPLEYWRGGERPEGFNTAAAYDTAQLVARAYDAMYRGNFTGVDIESVLDYMRASSFTGVTGPINLGGSSDNSDVFQVYNYRYRVNATRGFKPIGTFYGDRLRALLAGGNETVSVSLSGTDVFEMDENVVFFDGTTSIPDLDVRNEFTYWDCEARELRTDKTGKSVRLDEPGRKAEYLDEKYECDGYIDCYNMSDEFECTASLPVGFIVVGVLVAVLLLLLVILLLAVLVLWLVKKETRVRKASPALNVLIILASILVVISVFTVFGQPHDVSCVFQPWAMIVPMSLLIGALCVRPVAIYHHFRFPTHTEFSDWLTVLITLLHTIPVIFLLVLWMIIATPSATLDEANGDYHHVCGSNGFTGPIGGIVIFVLILAYEGIVLLVCAFISILARKVVVPFNESRVVATAIYNILLAGAIAIPLYFVLSDNNVARWSVLVGVMLYIPVSTIVILYVPKVYAILWIDPKKAKMAQELGVKQKPTSGTGDKNDFF
eukprot:TRINITY_DN11099_c0_g1_i1.p1 TRINITY_DN11099_c0_g1~~TRINITY_DN11099_c0_g1_i1.p1  ORF type:complete len:1054 (+),score=291.64 TRINITY_DN11099_c0_g1_i1:135-3164(+)